MKEYVVKVFKNKTQWYQNGLLHRDDGPAIEWADGGEMWFKNGEYHRGD